MSSFENLASQGEGTLTAILVEGHLGRHQPGLTTPPKFTGKDFFLRKGVSGFTTSPLFMIFLTLFIRAFLVCLFTVARLTVSLGSFSRL